MSLKRLGKSIKKAVKFEKSHTKNLWKGIKDDPKRLFLGVDPFSTKMWNKALGRDDRALVNQLGGATSYDYQVALDEGIDIGPGQALHTVAGAVAGAYAGGALGQAAGAGAGAIPGVAVGPTTQTAITAGTQMAVPAATAALEDTLEEEEEEGIGLGGLGSLRVGNVPTYRRAKGGYASPAQARLMRATAHGWKKPGGGGPSRAVAQEFVDAKDRNMYSGGFAENRYWTGGLAAMNEINSGVPQTLNFQEGGSVGTGYLDYYGNEPQVLDLGDFRDVLKIGAMQAEGWQFEEATGTMYPPLWNIETGGLEQTILGETQPTTTTTAPDTTGIGTPYVGYTGGMAWDWGGYGNYADWRQAMIDNGTMLPEPEPAPVRDIPGAGTLEPINAGTGAGESTGSQWTPEQIAAWEAEQTANERQSPYRDQLREHKARIAATLNPVAQSISQGYARGGRVGMKKPKGYQSGGFAMSEAQREALRQRYAGYQPQATPTTNPTPAELHEWWLENPGVPYPGSGQVARDSAPVTMTATNTAPVEMITLPGRDSIPLGEPVDMSVYKTSGIAGILKKMTESALEQKGYYEGENGIWHPSGSTANAPGGTSEGVRDIPGAAGTGGGSGSITGAVFGAAKQLLGQGKWTPEQMAAWEAKQTAASRQSGHRDQLRGHQARAASALNPGSMPPTKVGTQPPVYGDAPEPGMAYAGGSPGYYAPGGPGRGGQLDVMGNYTDETGYDPKDFSDDAVAARRQAESAYLDSIGYEQPWMTAAAKGGYMNYQEGGAARPTPVEGGGAPIAGHQEGTNPFDMATHPSSYRNWERKYHYAPPPPPPPPEPEEEPGWWASLFGAEEERKTRTQRELEAMGEARGGYMRGYRGGGHVRRFQGGGLAQAQQQAMGDFNAQQTALRQPRGGIPPATGGQPRRAGGVPPRWSPQQQASWRGARGNPVARSAMGQQHRQQQQALMNRAPQQAGRAGMMANAQRQQQALQQRGGAGRMQAQQQALAQRGAPGAAQPGMSYAGGTPGFYGPGGPGRGPSIGGGSDLASRFTSQLGGNRFGEQMRQATGRQTYQDVVNRGGGGINPRLPGGGRMYGGDGGGGGITGGARVPPNMQGYLQKQRMMNRPPSNVGGGVNRVGQQDQQGGLSRAMQRGTGRRPMSRRGGFPGGGMR